MTSCTPASPVLVRPQVDIPARPVMLPVTWLHVDPEASCPHAGMHVVDDSQARSLSINTSRLKAHIKVLEGYLQAVNE